VDAASIFRLKIGRVRRDPQLSHFSLEDEEQ
jgi:hypothetical protein